jgi:hypothetical protein
MSIAERGGTCEVVVLVFGTLRFPPEKMDQVRAPLRDLVEATVRLDGCIAYDVAGFTKLGHLGAHELPVGVQ